MERGQQTLPITSKEPRNILKFPPWQIAAGGMRGALEKAAFGKYKDLIFHKGVFVPAFQLTTKRII
jgi:hypothetical protein